MSDKIVVTGADGFIGSHLTEHLVRAGHDVRAFVQYNSFGSWGWLDNCDSEILNGLEIVMGDIRDPRGVYEAVSDREVVLHLAALIAIPYSYRSPHSYVETNVLGTLNVLEAARLNKIEKLIHTSTSEVYGSPETIPINELNPLKGQSPYAATKIAADQLAYSYFASYDLPVVICRPFNTYGPRQSARAVISTVISQIAAGHRNIVLGTVSTRRDFTFIEDTVAGFDSILNGDGGYGEVFNLGCGYDVSIRELVHLIADVMGEEVSIETDSKRIRPENSEVDRLLSDNTKVREKFGWRPKFAGISGLRNGLEQTIDWFSNESNLRRYKIGVYNT